MTTVVGEAWTAQRVEDALRRRRLARDGGAYSLFLDEPAREGALAGLLVAVKDLFDVAGTRTRAGSASREDAPVSTDDAPAVAALRAAGARLVGKTALHEFAFGVTGINDFEGTPRNPRDPSCIAGGSSSGSAVAVAEGSCAAALGTDTGGSVRIPAALCGVVGVKPSFGAISSVGVYPLSPSLDHVGVIAESVDTAARVLATLAPEREWTGPEPRTIGLDVRGMKDATSTVARAIEAQLARSRARVVEVELPDPELVFAVTTTIMFAEAAAQHASLTRERTGAYGADVRERIVLGAAIPAAVYLRAQEAGGRLREEIATLFASVDAIVGPTVGTTAYSLEEARSPAAAQALVRHTRLWNVTGTPALSIPVHDGGLPIGMQVIAATDGRALAAGRVFERR